MRCLLLICLSFILLPEAQAQIYVATHGSDRAEGTKEAPLATVHTALRKAREWRRLKNPGAEKGIRIYVSGGVYRFEEPLFIRSEDAGTAAGPTTIEAVINETVIFSGGQKITGWKKAGGVIRHLPANAKGKVWIADAPVKGDAILDFRQLWVNNKKAIRARDRNADSMYRILAWDHKTEQCWIPKPSTSIADTPGLEMVIHQWWAIANLRVKSIKVKGDSVLLSFHQPESKVQSEHPWPAPWHSKETGNSAFYLTNAIQFLDSPGEWYLDKAAQKIYYWPRSNEDLRTATVIAPALETLVRVEGTLDHPVANVHFKNIAFQHATWMRPSQQGHVPHQIGMYMLDAYKLKQPGTADKQTLENQAWVGRPAAAVNIAFANNINIDGCRFEHLAATGLDLGKGVQDAGIKGNLFKDVGGTAILAGHFSDEASEVHLPYNPKDEREVSSNINITNNLVNDVGNEDWGCVGIGGGYLRNSTIAHNDISELPYMGISLGWGWSPTPNVMKANKVMGNKIHRFARQLYDVAGIYTLSAQPGTEISGNAIDSAYKAPYAHLPSHWFYLYTDEGSSHITVKDNWTPSQKFLQNANGPGNVWTNNGPAVSENIKAAAGLQPAFRHLLKYREVLYPTWGIVHEQPVIVELVTQKNALDLARLKTILLQYKVDTAAIYHWQNRYVIFDKVQDVSVLRGKLQDQFPDAQVKVYYDAFYEFNRQRCENTATTTERQHILLTANLVADPRLQQEYMRYHASQFQQWPEVSKGFCKADFQQLLLYRNGRQLMLVISIPKGESLDNLNPKTTENNPRVEEWNRIMKKYQEGLEGTKPGETWIFLQKLAAN
ncbi:L-rhamnose mutarotase [Flavisolibacter sp. BT320]|nr:L-rhamnose mutarotase [Flavisolibacter longurius]